MKQHWPAPERNKDPILDVLRPLLTTPGLVLELASGTGQHAVHMAGNLPHLTWQPSDPGEDALASLAAWQAETGLPNLLPPVRVDACAQRWGWEERDDVAAVVCINMIHIAPWSACQGLIAGAARTLRAGAVLYLYGPYQFDGTFHAPSNASFDRSLRERDSTWGVRDLTEVTRLASGAGLEREAVVDMPANNHSVIFRRV